ASRQSVFQESVFAPAGHTPSARPAAARGYVPKHLRVSTALQSGPMPAPLEPQESLDSMGGFAEPMDLRTSPMGGPEHHEYYEGLPSMLHEEAGPCGHVGCGLECCDPLGCGSLCWDGCEAFAGVQGFTGPVNRGSTGSFGFHQGVNWGTPLHALFGDAIAGQIGMRATQSNFNEAEFT